MKRITVVKSIIYGAYKRSDSTTDVLHCTLLPNTASRMSTGMICTRLVGVCAFVGTLRGFKWIPIK